MSGAGQQLVLDLPHREALGRDDFFVTPSNASAVASVDRWPDWPVRVVALVGPAGSGKSHLAEVWRQKSGARLVSGGEVTVEAVPALLAQAAGLVIDSVEPGGFDERALFHLLNLARQQQADLLFTSTQVPDQWGVRLPDLRTRLAALAVITLGPPDDLLLRAVLVKLFTDRQLAVDEGLVSYMLARMPRSLDAARALVALIDRQALTERAEVTRPFVARLLQEFSSRDLFAPDD